MDSKVNNISNYLKDIVTDYDQLSQRCDEVEIVKNNKEIQEIILSLKTTIRSKEDISALSANQIGYDKRIICLNFNGTIHSFINPIVTSVEGFELSREKCHSIPGKEYIRPRHNKIYITYQTPLGKIKSIELMGMAARIFQHHMDHLDGLLLSDIGLEILPEFDIATEEERNEVINMYLDSIDVTKDILDSEIQNDTEAKKIIDGVKFIQSVQSGKTKIEHIPWTEDQIKIYEDYKKASKNEVST